jgi:methylated-DNA-[protein]-cysteine S-methyltransferase
MITECKAYFQSEIGLLEIIGTEAGLVSVGFLEQEADTDYRSSAEMLPVVAQCVYQLDEYFQGKRKVFELALAPQGTDFQKRVWAQLLEIPYGETVSYMDLARALGNEKTIRAAGVPNGANPVAIIVPCHRVIGSGGKLTGYGGGLWRKEWLLNHERRFSSRGQLPLF